MTPPSDIMPGSIGIPALGAARAIRRGGAAQDGPPGREGPFVHEGTLAQEGACARRGAALGRSWAAMRPGPGRGAWVAAHTAAAFFSMATIRRTS